VVRIGTRALISISGKPVLATHWDGYPSSLGLDLLSCDKSLRNIIEVAENHTIDAAHISILKELNNERVKQLAKQHHLTVCEIRAGKRRGCVIRAEDYEIFDINDYGDWAEYQYDIRGNEVYFRALEGSWSESVKKASDFKLLTRNRAEKY
jgi:hypothetical protein